MDDLEQLTNARQALQAGDYNTATSLCQKILALNPEHLDALHLLGGIFKIQHQLDAAFDTYKKALQLAPTHIETLMALADICTTQRQYGMAIAYLNHAININFSLPILHEKLAAIFSLLGKTENADEENFYAQIKLAQDKTPDIAVQICDAFLSRYPHHVDALTYKGVALEALRKYQEAVLSYEQALALDPALPLVQVNKGNAEQSLARFEEAFTSYNVAVALDSQYIPAVYNRGLCSLLLGKYSSGWQDYESRLFTPLDGRTDDLIADYHQFKNTQWLGEPHKDDYLFIWNEQGIGDEILFSSMFNDAIPFFEKIIVEADPRLVDLFSRSFPKLQVIARKSTRDYSPPNNKKLWHLPCGSLGKFFRNSPLDFTNQGGYLIADHKKTNDYLHAIKKNTSSSLIGISWKSIAKTGSDKTLPLDGLAKRLAHSSSAQFLSLQYLADNSDCRLFEQHAHQQLLMPDFDVFNNIDDLAALINACDTIITCSNLTAHLAGALGKTTFLLAPTGDGLLWYWGAHQPTTPWYASIHIIRQSQPGNWDSAFDKLARLLQQHMP